jgi:hypothetical protein
MKVHWHLPVPVSVRCIMMIYTVLVADQRQPERRASDGAQCGARVGPGPLQARPPASRPGLSIGVRVSCTAANGPVTQVTVTGRDSDAELLDCPFKSGQARYRLSQADTTAEQVGLKFRARANTTEGQTAATAKAHRPA